MRTLTTEGMAIFCAGAAAGMLFTVIGTLLALQCLAWRGLW